MGRNVSFHRFPKNKSLCKIWVQKCHRKDKFNSNTSHICSIHFTEDNFETSNLQSKLLKLSVRRRLIPNAIPSLILLPHSQEDTVEETDREIRRQQKINKNVVKELLDGSICHTEPSTCTSEIFNQNNLDINENWQQKYEELLKQYDAIKQENHSLKTETENQKAYTIEKNSHIKSLEKNITKLKSNITAENSYRSNIEVVLKNFLTKAQRDLVFGRKKKVVWSSEDISNAFAIRYFSKQCYLYLKEKKKYPLPAISSLQRWAAKINLKQGILSDVLRIMEVAQHEMSELEKNVILQFDEVKVKSVYEYDKADDTVIGPHMQMQVVMVRGLFAKYKQPVFIGFDTKMTQDILNQIIIKLHEINYIVVACVSDCGGGNIGLWKQMSITVENTSFLHPVTRQDIYFFADVPHLLKLVRNWLLDYGFTLGNGTQVTAHPVRLLVDQTNTEVSSCFKINKVHIECAGSLRQNVALAAQLLSHTTGTALLHYLPGENKEAAKITGEFILKINKWFDVMNSYTTKAAVSTKKPYGLNLEEQNSILQESFDLIKNMRCINHSQKSLQTFQKGILISTSSLQKLFLNLKEKYGISYILTNRLNQDSLENFFSQIRGKGGFNDHPSPLDAIYRVRMIMLGKNPGLVKKHSNVQEFEEGDYITTKVITQTVGVPNIENSRVDDDSDFSFSSDSDMIPSDQKVYAPAIHPNVQSWSENDGLEYLAGWVAFKFKKKYPDMGQHTYKITTNQYNNLPKWVLHLSFGGLMQPTEKWLEQAKILEKIFLKYNESSFKKIKKLCQRMVKIANKKLPELALDVANAYLLQRIFIRIKYLNQKNEQKNTKRKLEKDHNDKAAKKMRKIVT